MERMRETERKMGVTSNNPFFWTCLNDCMQFLMLLLNGEGGWEDTQPDGRRQVQCDQIGRFIGLCTTFQSLQQQLICPNLPHYQAIFVKVSKSFIFLVKSFLATLLQTFGDFLLVTLDRQDKQTDRVGTKAVERETEGRTDRQTVQLCWSR